ncbi:MAG: glycosyltransferase [Opitutales bacterium]
MPAARDCALVTLQIGEAPYFAPARQNFQRLCAQFSWDFRIIDQRWWRLLPIRRAVRRLQFEKFQLFDLLAEYRRILFLDSDILALPSLPDVFAEVPETSLGCVDEATGPLAWKREAEREKALRKRPLPDWTTGYFNSGMLVLSHVHRPLFEMRRWQLLGGRWADQTTLNHRARSLGIPLNALDSRFNFLPVFEGWNERERRLQAHLIHYAGRAGKAAYAADLEHVEARWRAPAPTAT